MLGRRYKDRGGPSDRRDFPRPPLLLNILLIAAAVGALLFAERERKEIAADYARVFDKNASAPSEVNQAIAELAEMDLTKDSLNKELDSRLAYLQNRKSKDFFLSIDTARRKISLNYGTDTVRDAGVRVGDPITFDGPSGKLLRLAPLKGAFTVAGKEFDVANALGKFVILLPNDYVIHSPPPAGLSPKPGSFMVPEADLKAIWDRITPETRVYIF